MTNPQQNPTQQVAANQQTANANQAANQPQNPTGNANAANYTTATTISSLGDLKAKAPEVYKAMVQGIMINIIQDGQRSLERWKQHMREGRENSGQS